MVKRQLGNIIATCAAVMGVIACSSDQASEPKREPKGTSSAAVSGSEFEDHDGNLAVDATDGGVGTDWNSFAKSGLWTGSAPSRASKNTASGWSFTGLEDWQATNSDSAFAGGVKQDTACATVGAGKAPNKDDLKRVYFASKTGSNGHVYLNLAWLRIPQNTTSPSAHIGFEFNQSSTPCGGSGGLVERSLGDMLIVYDFEGGSTDTPTITLRRWVTAGACEVSSNSPPCWGPSRNLTADGIAEAKVNTFGSTSDGVAPSPPETLGTNEFGEAGIDLTEAGVFTAGTCSAFGKAYAVSRSSGNSATAQMKDLVGPGNVDLKNCGAVVIRKVTVPNPDPNDGTFAFTTTGADLSGFNLKNGGTKDFGSLIHEGSKTVTESDPSPKYVLSAIDCSASETSDGSSVTPDLATRSVSFSLKANDKVECTFTNTLQLGAIKITKTVKDKLVNGNPVPLAGAKFTVTGPGGSSTTLTTGSNGTVCVDKLAFGSYGVTESEAPTGYRIDDTTTHSVTVDNNANCDDATYVGEGLSFTNTPLSEIQVQFRSLAGPGVTKASIVCTKGGVSVAPVSENGVADPAYDDTDETITSLVPGTYICTVVVDP